jgi:peroxiredoxin
MTRAGSTSILTGILLVIAAAVPAASELPGTAAPDFALKSLAGENLRLSEYRGEVVMLSFWASWCGECRAHLERLADMYARYQGAGVALIAVTLDQSARQAGETASALDLSYPVLHDARGEVGRLYAVERMPMTVLIDREGVVREVFDGSRRGSEQEYLESVRLLLRE